jgi:hypothetical protein
MFTNLSGWLLKPYAAYQFRKSSIKKLYKYNRVKKQKKDSVKKKDLKVRDFRGASLGDDTY